MTAAPAHPKPNLFFEQQISERLSVTMSRQDDGTRSYLVLAAVLQEWAEVGFLSAQMPSIAARAGLTSATLDRLFPNRADLHLEALALGQQLIVEAMKKSYLAAGPRFANLTMVPKPLELNAIGSGAAQWWQTMDRKPIVRLMFTAVLLAILALAAWFFLLD
jgi:AcrR family transcriptional regulator